MHTLALVIAEMRAMGVKSLALELEPVNPTYEDPDARPTEAPPEREPDKPQPDKPLDQCAAHGCSARKGGVFGNAVEYCQEHALTLAGVKP